MVANALFVTTLLFLAGLLYLMQECEFLIPYRRLLWEQYAGAIARFAALLYLNVFAAVYAAWRKLFLKDTGQKLAHLEKQLKGGVSLSRELSERLKD